MDNGAFGDFLASIQAKIGNLNNVTVLKKRAVSFKTRADAGDTQAATNRAATEDDMMNKKEAIDVLKAFFVTMKKQ